MAHKLSLEHAEKVGHGDPMHYSEVVKHGDRALEMIGDERVTLTDEEVRRDLKMISLQPCSYVYRTNASEGRQTVSYSLSSSGFTSCKSVALRAKKLQASPLTNSQILDKSVLGYGAIFGLEEATHLKGNEYSFVGSIAPIAQLAWQPFSSFLIVKVPHRILMPSLCLGWGIAQAAMAACTSYGDLLAARFFLGLFEAGCLPLFSIITSQWSVLIIGLLSV